MTSAYAGSGGGANRGARLAQVRLSAQARPVLSQETIVHLVQLLLPLHDNVGTAFDAALYRTVRVELTERFGGVTAWLRAPASGSWKDHDGHIERDEIVVYEVMDAQLDTQWWASYREELRHRFRQDELIARATPLLML